MKAGKIGKSAAELGTHVWYAPAGNLYRNPLGAQSENVVVTIKHFALNDQETNRFGVFTWCDEQAMRELHLKPFEIAVKEGEAYGIMSSLNRIGAQWCGGSYALLTKLLREEWGFDGMVITDAYMNLTGTGYMNPNLAVYAGNDELLCMAWFLRKLPLVASMKRAYQNDPIGYGEALRKCVRNICVAKMRTNAFLTTIA